MKNTIYILCVFVFGNLLSQNNLNVNLLYNWKDSTMIASSAHQNKYNEIWGYVKDGREYAIIGSTRGTHFFDVTNPSNSIQVDFVQGNDTGTAIVHRDYHDYAGYLYAVSDEGNATLQIMDLSFLPDSISVVFNSAIPFKRSHNIFIDSATAKMYVCGGENKFDIYDLTNPLSPTLLKRCNLDIPWWNAAVSGGDGYVHDVFVKNDTAWCNAENGLYVVDFTNMSNPVLLASFNSYPDKGYNHSGWLKSDGLTYAMADEDHGKKVKILDVSDIGNIQFVDTIGSDVHPLSIPHNLIFKDNYLYVSYYFDGVYIWDLSNPSAPILVGFYDTSNEPHNTTYRGNWGVYPFLPSGIILASDMQEGLFVLDASPATNILNALQKEDVFKLFPNPVKDELTVLGTQNFGGEFVIELIDLSGKILLRKPFKNQFLTKEIISLPASIQTGIYLVTIKGVNYSQTQRIVKQ